MAERAEAPETEERPDADEQEELERLRSTDVARKRSTAKAQQDLMLSVKNKRHAFIANYGGHAVVTDYEPVPDNPTKQRLGIVEISAIKARYSNQFVPGSEDNERP